MSSSKNEQKEAFDPNLDQNFQNARKAIKILEEAGYQARMAGGCVRDRLMKQRPKDYDIATNALPETVCLIFKQKNLKTIPTGIDHGTITLVLGGQPLEITSLRIDVATDGRRAVVAFGESFEDDSLRRDFTINALYEDGEGNIYDYHGGLKDLADKTLRFVGDAKTRMQEDYLRILRLFRFWARLEFSPAPGTLEAVAKEVRGLAQISSERITSELLQTLECRGYPAIVPGLYASGCLEVILGSNPEERLLKQPWAALFLNKKADTAIARLSLLLACLPDSEKAREALGKLRLSKAQQELVNTLIWAERPAQVSDPAEVLEWLDKLEGRLGESAWNDVVLPVWMLTRADSALVDMDALIQANLHRRSPPLDGQTLIRELGIAQGPQLGALMLELKRAYRRGLWVAKEEGLLLAKTLSAKS